MSKLQPQVAEYPVGIPVTTDLAITSIETAVIIEQVLTELARAKTKHPTWPTDNVKRAAIVLEEAGEVIREANNLDEDRGSIENLKDELIQTASAALRMLEELGRERKDY